MPDQWYYAHEMNKCGPVSSRQLREFAAAGVIGRTDRIWKEGVERGVVAAKVKNLFPPAAPPPPGSESPAAFVPLAMEDAHNQPTDPTHGAAPGPANLAVVSPIAQDKPVKKLRAVALRGLVIITQDGTHVQFKKKCVACGREDPSKVRVPIKIGINGVSFYCAKCKERRVAEFRGEHFSANQHGRPDSAMGDLVAPALG